MTEQKLIAITPDRAALIVMVLFIVVAGVYSVVTPLFEMSDELWHYPMVKRLADGDGLVVQDPENVGPWRQEGSQAPLYYYTGGALTFWIDTSDMSGVRRENPHVDNGLITADGNNNLIVHDFPREAWPWRGTVLAVHLVRFFSVLLSAGTVYLTYQIGREVLPECPWIGVLAATLAGFTPMFTFISGSVNNDNMAVLLATAALYVMVRMVRISEEETPNIEYSILLGVLLGLAALTKTSTLGFIGLAGITTGYVAIRRKRWQSFWIEGPLIIAIIAIIAGWWYWRNWALYGDPLGLNMFIAVLGQRARPASLAQLWTERQGFMQSYWGLFGGVNVPMPGTAYTLLNMLGILGTVGIVVFVIMQFLGKERRTLADWMPLIMMFLAIAVIVGPLAGSWSRNTWSSQGRLVFYSISAISIGLAAGLTAWIPNKQIASAVGSAVGLLFFGLSAAAPFAWITPAYAVPEITSQPIQDDAEAVFAPQGEAPAMQLLRYSVTPSTTYPDDAVEVTLTWQVLDEMASNWSVFIHLEDSTTLLAGQRDTYPGVGSLATSDLEPGMTWTDYYVIPVNATAYAPEHLAVMVGLYDYGSCPVCNRMVMQNGNSAIEIGTVALRPVPSENDIPNPTNINFQNRIGIEGYEISERVIEPGGRTELTLHLTALEAMTRDYTVSVQVVGADTTRYAQIDTWPGGGSRPTSAWDTGETLVDTYPLTLSPDTPPGIYPVQVVIYWQDEDGAFNRLQTITADGRLTDDFVLLTRVRVLP